MVVVDSLQLAPCVVESAVYAAALCAVAAEAVVVSLEVLASAAVVQRWVDHWLTLGGSGAPSCEEAQVVA